MVLCFQLAYIIYPMQRQLKHLVSVIDLLVIARDHHLATLYSGLFKLSIRNHRR